MNVLEKALAIVEAIQTELALGTKHYSQKTGELLTNPKRIAEALRDNDLTIEPWNLNKELK